MSKLGINTGSNVNDGTGDTLIDGAVKVNSNFNEIYSIIGDGNTLSAPVTSVTAGTGINLSGSSGSVTITNTGIANTNNLRTDFLEVSGISTLTGVLNANGGVVGNVTGSSSQVTVSDESSDTTCFPLFTTDATGNLPPKSGSNLTFNSSTGSLTATSFSGSGANITGISTLNIVNYGVGLGGGSGVGNTNNLRTDFLEVSGISTFNSGISVTGIATATSFAGYDYLQSPFGSTVTFEVTVASKDATHRYNGSGSGNGYLINGVQSPFLTLTPGRTYRFTNDNTGSHPLKFYLESDKTTLYSTGVTFDNAYTEIVVSDSTPQVLHYQCTNHSLMGNAVTVNTNKLQTPYTVSVGSGSSTNGVDSPSLTLSHNNPTVVGTSGTTGQIKQIGGQPYYYDGTTWRALFLVGAASTVNQADTDWDNTMIRMNFDQANIGSVTNLKDGRSPNSISGVDLVASPVKYGTKSARLQSSNTGITFDQDNSGSVYYSFEGSWTLEGWFYFDSYSLPTVTNLSNSPILFSNFSDSNTPSSSWRIGFYYTGTSTNYKFYWHNRSSTDTGSGGAGNNVTGFVLGTISSNSFADNNWHHFAIVRESSDGSIHFYFDGTESNDTSSDQLIDNNINNRTGLDFSIGYFNQTSDTGRFLGNVDDVRVSSIARYTSNFTPPSSALPITGSTTTVYEPADSKVGEISLGGSPSWTGTPGVTASQIASGQYRATFDTAYSNATDYVIQTSMNDYTPVTTPVGIGVSRFTTHADFFVRRVSDGANIDTGSLAIDLFKK